LRPAPGPPPSLSSGRRWYHRRKREGKLRIHARHLAVFFAVASASCFHQTGPEDPSPIELPIQVTVTVQYRQPNSCANTTDTCDTRVVFFGSWMPNGTGVLLTRSTPFVWTGRVSGVPVNFPPRDQPYLVRVDDPHLRDTATGGVTADRLTVGG